MWAAYKSIYYWSGKARLKGLKEIDLMTGRREIGLKEWARLEEYENWGMGRRALSYFRF